MSEYGIVTAPGTVRFERLLPGPIERVWEYLADSDKRATWLASGVMEPRVGAEFNLYFKHDDLSPIKAPAPEKYKNAGSVTSEHRVTRFEPPRFLSITWGDLKNPTEVSFELKPEGDKVRLILVHNRLPDRTHMVLVAGGWQTHLAILVERLNGRTPPAFWALLGDIESQYEKRFATALGDPPKTP